jgi:antitoxin ParD1/3/4
MGKITISLPDDMVEHVEAQIGEEFANADAYLAELVRRDQEDLAELRRIVEEAQASGISDRSLDQIFEAAVERVRAKGMLRD